MVSPTLRAIWLMALGRAVDAYARAVHAGALGAGRGLDCASAGG